MMKKIALFGVIVLLLVILGCTNTPKAPVCGNSVIETGEDCDVNGCAVGKTCQDCRCVVEVLTPPPMPE